MDYLEGFKTQGKNISYLKNQLDLLEIKKVDKEFGKQLSTENFTKEYKDYIEEQLKNNRSIQRGTN